MLPKFHVIFIFFLFGIKEFRKLWKKPFKTIHRLSRFLGHPVGLHFDVNLKGEKNDRPHN